MKHVLWILIVSLASTACKKDDKPTTNPVPPPEKGWLKDISYSNLPSPYYHFEYNSDGRVQKISFSDAMAQYNVAYETNGISHIEKTNADNHDKLVYTYQEAGKPIYIEYTRFTGEVYQRCFITYNAQGQIINMEWETKINGAGFMQLRELTFSYYSDGNLKDLNGHGFAIDGVQEEYTYTEHYENYDSNLNTDDFTLYQTNNDHTLLLPGIRIQQNNPGKVTRSGGPFSFEITYAYTCQNKYPVSRNGFMKITSGSDAGKEFFIAAGYTYY